VSSKTFQIYRESLPNVNPIIPLSVFSGGAKEVGWARLDAARTGAEQQ
jgi:hypothetical protein